jgi:hypothetical protein
LIIPALSLSHEPVASYETSLNSQTDIVSRLTVVFARRRVVEATVLAVIARRKVGGDKVHESGSQLVEHDTVLGRIKSFVPAFVRYDNMNVGEIGQ